MPEPVSLEAHTEHRGQQPGIRRHENNGECHDKHIGHGGRHGPQHAPGPRPPINGGGKPHVPYWRRAHPLREWDHHPAHTIAIHDTIQPKWAVPQKYCFRKTARAKRETVAR